MARVLYECLQPWEAHTLEPNPDSGVVLSVSSGGTPDTKCKEHWGGKISWLTPKELARNKNLGIPLIINTERMLTKTGTASCGASFFDEGTVMLSKRAPVGLVAISADKMTTNQGFLNIVCGDKLDSKYLAYWLQANTHYLEMVANGTTYSELYASDLFEFTIHLPPIDYQQKVVSFMDNMNVMINLITASGRSRDGSKYANLANDILPHLLTGSILV